MNPKIHSIIAIDISKDSLDVYTEEESLVLPNNRSGFDRLLRRLGPLASPFVVFEATGGYERALKEALHEACVSLCLVNPTRIRAFAISEGLKAKTDPIDARLIWRFALEKQLRPTPASSPQESRLIALMDRRSHLTEQLAREKTRLKKAPEAITTSIRKMIDFVTSEIQELEVEIQRLVADNEPMNRINTALQTIKGVGKVTAWSVLAYLPEITQLKRNAIVALAGIAPFNKDSGKMSKRRCIQGGRAKVRSALYMAAQTAANHNEVIKPYVARLIAKGKPYKCAIVAAMRKLLIHMQSVLKNSETELAL